MKRFVPVLVAVCILFAVGGMFWFLWQKSRSKPVVFETESPSMQTIVKKTVATGAIVPRQEIEIKPRISGVIEKLHVEAGNSVKEGDPIALIRLIPNLVSVNAAESQLNSAKISLQGAKRELERNRALYRDKLLSETDLNRFELDYRLRESDFRASQSNLDLIKSGAAKSAGKVSNVVLSTVAGTIVEVPVKVGTSVTETNNFNPGSTIAVVANMGDLIFQGKVDESEVGKIKNDMPLEISVGALPGQTFAGKLEYISPKGISVEGTIQFEIKASLIIPAGTTIRANYSANANVVLERRDNVLAINEGLVQFEKDGSTFVEVETGNHSFQKIPVKLGLSDGITIEVLSGIDPNAKIKRPIAAPSDGAGRPGKS